MQYIESIKLLAVENFIEDVTKHEERIINNIIKKGQMNEKSVKILEKISYFFFMARLLEKIIEELGEEKLIDPQDPGINGFYEMVNECYPEFISLVTAHNNIFKNKVEEESNGLLH